MDAITREYPSQALWNQESRTRAAGLGRPLCCARQDQRLARLKRSDRLQCFVGLVQRKPVRDLPFEQVAVLRVFEQAESAVDVARLEAPASGQAKLLTSD